MNDYTMPKPEKYINPNRVNTTKFIRIFSNDPRNNPTFLKNNPYAEVINVDFDNEENVNELSFDLDPSIQLPQDPLPGEGEQNISTLTAPTNLSISNFELKVSGDGNIYYIATLSFDDVLNASSYEATTPEIVL